MGYITGANANWFLANFEQYNNFVKDGTDADLGTLIGYNFGQAKFKQGTDNNFTLIGVALGESWEGWLEAQDTSTPFDSNKNPTTTAAQRAIIHAIMGTFASKEFYNYMLSKGYVYTHGGSDFTLEAPFEPPSVWVSNVAKSVTADGMFPISGVPTNANILPPEKNPPYGTHQDPTYEPPTTIDEPPKFFVSQGNSNVPEWVVEWSSIVHVGSEGMYGLLYTAYKADITIDADLFIENYLVSKGLVKYQPSEATAKQADWEALSALGGTTESPTESKWKGFFNGHISEEGKTPPVALPNTENIQAQYPYPDASHYVLLKGTVGKPPKPKTALAVRTRPTKSQKAQVVGSLTNGDVVLVEKEFIGARRQWHLIKVVQEGHPLASYKGNLYASSKFLEKLPNTPYSLDRVYKCKRLPRKAFQLPDWPVLKDKTAFIDRRVCDYCVIIEPVDELTGKKYTEIPAPCDENLAKIKLRALEMGVYELLKFYNKKMDIDADGTNNTLSTILGAFKGPYVKKGDWYLSLRPRSKVRVLVRFPAKYFDALPENVEELEGVPTVGTPQPIPPQTEEEAVVADPVVPQIRTVHFVISSLSDKINAIIDSMGCFAKGIDGWMGDIPGLDLTKEMKRLERFPLALKQFLKLNGYTVDEKEEDTIELGFDSSFKLQYVLLNKAGFSSPLRVGFDKFKNTDPINISRTMGYVFYLDDLAREAKKSKKINWVDYVQKYTFPIPEIKPSKISIEGPTSKGATNEKKMAQKLAAKYDRIETVTLSGQRELEKEIDNPSLKKKLATIRKKQKEFVGDEFIRQIPELLEKLEDLTCGGSASLDVLYSSILNRVDIKELASLGAMAQAAKMPSGDVSITIVEDALEEMSHKDLVEVYTSFPDSVRAEIDLHITQQEAFKSIDIEQYLKPEIPIPSEGLPTAEVDVIYSIPELDEALKGALVEVPDPPQLIASVKIVKPDIEKEVKNLMPSADAIPSLDTPDFTVPNVPTPPVMDCLNMPSLKLPNVPTITIPEVGLDLFKIADTMSDISVNLRVQIEEITCSTLYEMVKLTLEGAFEAIFASDGDSNFTGKYGNKNLNDMFNQTKGGVARAFKDLDLPVQTSDISGGPKAETTVISMIDDVSAVLTPLEIVDVLQGAATPETLTVVESVVSENYPSMMEQIRKASNIKDVFEHMGNFVDESLLDSIRRLSKIFPSAITGLLCQDDARSRAEAIQEHGKRLSDECSEEQYKRKRKRRRKKLKRLLALTKNADKILNNVMAPTVSSCGEAVTGVSDDVSISGVGGIIPKDHESIKYMNKKVIKNMFEIPNMHFNTEINTYLDSLLKQSFENPTKYDAEFDGLKQKLDWDEEKVTKGGQGLLEGADQKKYDQAAVDYQKLSIKVAPQVKNSLFNPDFFIEQNVEFVNFMGAQTSFVKDSKQRMRLNYTQYTTDTEAIKKIQEAKDDLDLALRRMKFWQTKADIASKSKNSKNGEIPPSLQKKVDKYATEAETANATLNTLKENFGPASKPSPVAKEESVTTTMVFKNEDSQTSAPLQNKSNLLLDINAASSMLNIFENVEITGSGKVPPLAETDLYSFNSTKGSWQEGAFANYAIRRWGDVANNVDLSSLENTNSDTFSYYSLIHSRIFNFILRRLGSAISNSPLFINDNLDDLNLGETKNNPDPSLCVPARMSGLLDIDNMQKIVSEIYDESCDERGKDFTKMGPLESSGIQGITYITIRLYVLETLLKSIFTFSQFSISETRSDELFSEFVALSVISGLQSHGNEYYDEFLKQTKVITDQRQKKGELLTNPLAEQSDDPLAQDEDGTLSDPEHPFTISGLSSLRFLIKEQIYLLSLEMDNRLNPPVKDVDSFFLGTGGPGFDGLVPTVDVPETRQHNRFEEIVDVVQDPTSLKKGATHYLKSEFFFLNEILNKENNFDRAGGFILEKYIRIEDKTEVNNWQSLSDEEKNFIQDIWFNRPGGVHNKFPQAYTKDGKLENKDLFDSGHLAGVVNVQSLVKYLASLKGAGYGDFNLKNIAEKFKFGLRLSYVAPISEANTQETAKVNIISVGTQGDIKLGDEKPQSSDGWEKNTSVSNNYQQIFDSLNQGDKDAIEKVSISEKAYWIQEHYQYLEPTSLEDTAQVSLDRRDAYILPLVTLEDAMGLDGLPQLTISDALELLQEGPRELAFNAMKEKMIKEPKYQFLFNYIFPLPRIVSLISLFNVLSTTKNVDGTAHMFDMTKDSLKSMFFNLIPGDPWYSKQDEKLEAKGGNMGMMQQDNDSMTMTGPASQPSVAKIAARAALILLKAQARQSDPHYSFVSKLDDVGAAPFGMTWGSVFPFWPVNFWLGWGPPLGPIGMAAYSAGLLPGEKRNKKKRKVIKEEAKPCSDTSSNIPIVPIVPFKLP